MALALVALLLPSRPASALAIAAGQLLAALNFFFLEKLVKLFTEASLARTPLEAAPLRLKLLLHATAKVALVYGGAFALTRWRGLDYVALVLGLSIPLAALFLKSLMLALRSGPASVWRRARSTAGPAGSPAKLAALLFLAGALAFAAPVRATAQEAQGGSAASAAAMTAPSDAPATLSAGAPAESASADRMAAHAPEGLGAEVAAESHVSEGKHEESEENLPNFVTILHDWVPKNPVVDWMFQNEVLVFAWVAGVLFLVIAWIAMRPRAHVPGELQNAVEWIVDSMEDVCAGMLGKQTKRYFPFIMAIFFYILVMNLIGIVPGFHSSTANLDCTLALALITFLYVQYSGIRNLGLLGYLDHLAGSPRDAVGFAMLPVMVPVHVLGELVKPVSLSCRLFGNIFGEDTLIVVFVGVAALCIKGSLVALAVPPLAGITALFMLLQTLTSIVQAMIFALLATVYLYMMLPHEEHAHGDEASHAH
ncbi:MAG: F0F1 ATP synthase subunit A [Hyphomicrobiales bacterium]